MARTRRTAISFRETLTLTLVCCLLLPSVTDRLNIQVPACSISLICRFFVIVPSALQKAHPGQSASTLALQNHLSCISSVQGR